jgi:hypothetical protein
MSRPDRSSAKRDRAPSRAQLHPEYLPVGTASAATASSTASSTSADNHGRDDDSAAGAVADHHLVRELRSELSGRLHPTAAARPELWRHPFRSFRVIYNVPDPDPHRFDADHDGIGCES